MSDERKTFDLANYEPGKRLAILNGNSDATLRYVVDCGDHGSVVFDVPVGMEFWLTVGQIPARVSFSPADDADRPVSDRRLMDYD